LSKTKKKKIVSKTKSDYILEILGLFEEKGKSKDWLLDEIKKHHIKLNVPPTVNTTQILSACPQKFLVHISEFLKEDEFAIEEVKTQTKTLHWFFTDIVGSSNPRASTKSQTRKINFLNSQIKKSETFRNRDPHTSKILPTGDGMAIGFADSPEQPLRLAIELHKAINLYNKKQIEKDKIQIRIGIDTGPVYFLKDIEGNDSVWGPGIILARRVMDLCGTNQIFASRRIGDDISNLTPEYKEIMHPIGDYSIKHGEQLLIYNIYGKNFGNKIAPKPPEELLSKEPSFEFDRVELQIEIQDKKHPYPAHHRYIWEIKNTTKTKLEHIHYDLGGDIPAELEDLNVSVLDENKNNLEIVSIEANRPHLKRFKVGLKKPLRKNQKAIVTLDYDWAEPERVFEYEFSSKCKKFAYLLTLPKGMPPEKVRVLEVVKDLGQKALAKPGPKIKTLKNKTQVTWESEKNHKVKPNDVYEFQW
jgi:hypothetical protein